MIGRLMRLAIGAGVRKPIGGERSKYMPHQGKQEIARRMRQDDAAHRKFINSIEDEIAKRRRQVPPPYDSPEASEWIRQGEFAHG